MNLHLSLSTPSLAVASLRGWQSAGMLVEFLCEGRDSSIELHTAKIGDYFNKDAGNLTAIDPQQHQCSGRYRRKSAVPT